MKENVKVTDENGNTTSEFSVDVKDAYEAMRRQIPDIDELEDFVSEDGEYVIPIEYALQSTIKVKAKNLKDAIAKAFVMYHSLPLDNDNAEYIEGTYRFNIESAEDAEEAQEFDHFGGVSIDENNQIIVDKS